MPRPFRKCSNTVAIVLADAEAKSVTWTFAQSKTGGRLMRDMDAGFAVSKPSSPMTAKTADIGLGVEGVSVTSSRLIALRKYTRRFVRQKRLRDVL
jgi:hypothetical protein